MRTPAWRSLLVAASIGYSSGMRSALLMLAPCLAIACGSNDPAAGETDGATSSTSQGPTGDSGNGPTSDSSPPSTTSSNGDATVSDASTTSGDPSSADTTGAAETSDGSETGDPQPVSDPRQPGGEDVVTATLEFSGDNGTPIPLSAFMPASDGPFPVVAFHHGFQLGPADYVSYGQHLASWGYVVLMPQMPNSDHVTLRAHLSALLDWAEGDGNAGPLEGRYDGETVALAGHSLGGKISFLTATTDLRVDAVFGIDPVDGVGGPGAQPSPQNPSVTPELMGLVLAPVAVVGETVNATGIAGMACAPEDENFHQFFVSTQTPAVEIEFLTANHMSFLDDPNCGIACFACPAGTDDPAVTRSMTHGYLVAFLQQQLRGIEGYRTYLAGDEAEPDVNAGLVTIETANGF